MKKILLVSNGDNFPKGGMRFIKNLHEKEPVSVTGFFYSSVNYDMLVTASLSASATGFLNEVRERSLEVDKHIEFFESECVQNQIDFAVHKESDIITDDLIKETRFADMIILSEELYCKDFSEKQPNDYMKTILHRSECPILLIPEEFLQLKKIILTYDGSRENMFAIKYFATLFAAFNSLESEIVYFKKDGSEMIPDMEYLEAYATKHFPDLTISKLHFDAKKYFETWLQYEKDVIIVSGSFARSDLSEAIRHSFIEHVIAGHTAPVFIAHNI